MFQIWKKINEKGIANFYEVSNLGRIKSLQHTTKFQFRSKYGKPSSREIVYKERILKPTQDHQGYYHVRLQNEDGKSATLYKIHRLVAKYFLYDYDEKLTVDHIDLNKSNNHVSNLRMIGKFENLEAFRQLFPDSNHLYTDGTQNFCSFKQYCRRKKLKYSKYYFLKSINQGIGYKHDSTKIFKKLK